jgi:hypothetical protein
MEWVKNDPFVFNDIKIVFLINIQFKLYKISESDEDVESLLSSAIVRKKMEVNTFE